MKHRTTKISTIAALALATAILSGCGGGGTTASTADTTAPTTTAAPSVSATTETATTLSVTVNENGTGYYLEQLTSAPAATQAQVLAANNSFAMTANVPATPVISGLTFNTPYTIYFVAKDAANNVQAAVQNVAFTTAPTTTAGYVTQGGLTWMLVTSYDNWTNANSYCTTTTINGLTGWRMPTQPELSALYAAYPNNSSVLTGQGWTLAYTWSSTQYGAGFYYVFGLNDGYVGASDAALNGYVSCVR